ncbi:MAG: undecaprenyldiphospho-muramoylpentapeptide beta-N-acetylglucosaminyltransferase [Gammaproteobacteria bacterium]
MKLKRVLIVAGGTGGHIFPALAVAEWLRQRQVTPVWLGSTRGMECTLVPAHGIELVRIAIAGIRGKGLLRLVFAPFAVARATLAAMIAILKIRPGVVLGMGGFASGPGGLAAWLCRRPLVIHEQNAVPGFTNRVLRHFATRVLAAYPGTFGGASNVQVTGNPLRADIGGIAPPTHRTRPPHPLRILVLGGSLGARSLNRVVPVGVARFAAFQQVEVRHQAGEREVTSTMDAYRSEGVQGVVEPFITDMAEAYAWADIVICRAGALTIAEVSAAGLPSILVPFPHAVDDHQTANARYLVDRGAAVMVADAELSAETVADALRSIADEPVRMAEMAAHARAAAYLTATEDVARHCLELLHD